MKYARWQTRRGSSGNSVYTDSRLTVDSELFRRVSFLLTLDNGGVPVSTVEIPGSCVAGGAPTPKTSTILPADNADFAMAA